MPAKMGGQKGIYLFLKYFSRHCNVICYTIKKNIAGPGEAFSVKNILSNHKLRYINIFVVQIKIFSFRKKTGNMPFSILASTKKKLPSLHTGPSNHIFPQKKKKQRQEKI